MNCDDIKTMLDDYVEGQLDKAQASAVKAHLAGCQPCRSEAEGLERVTSFISQARPVRVPADAVTNVIAQMRRIEAHKRREEVFARHLAWGLAAALLLVLAGLDVFGVFPVSRELGMYLNLGKEKALEPMSGVMNWFNYYRDFLPKVMFYVKLGGVALAAVVFFMAAAEESLMGRLAHKLHMNR